MSVRKVKCRGHEIQYELIRKKVKNINMRIVGDGEVRVSANQRVSAAYVDDFVVRHADFIFDAQARCIRRTGKNMYPENYETGDIFMLLGRELSVAVYRTGQLKTISGGKETYINRECVLKNEDKVYIIVNDPEDLHRREYLFKKWLREQHIMIFEKICRQVYPPFQKMGYAYPEISIRLMKAKWGLCRPQSGRITFNSRLAMAPPSCIQYVAVHEFVHFIHPDHSKNFYAVLTKFLPDWKEKKKFLNENY